MYLNGSRETKIKIKSKAVFTFYENFIEELRQWAQFLTKFKYFESYNLYKIISLLPNCFKRLT